MEIKVEIIKRETIKPSFSTPHHLRSFDLCLIDQLQAEAYTPLVFFYSSNTDSPLSHVKIAERSQRLKTSLSETLTRFYPLAGKIKDNASIECNDDGADYLEARVNCCLSDILKQPEHKILLPFLPKEINESMQAATGRLVVVQASFFECGGVAIAVCVCHRLADAFTHTMFIHSWARTALIGSGEAVLPPEFVAASRLPPRREFSVIPPALHLVNEKSVTRRYVFEASKIAALKAKATSGSVQKPTRVEAVTALIWRCATAISRSKYGSLRPSKLIQMMNIRKRLVPPLPENTFGNLVWSFAAQTGDRDIELQSLVRGLRKGIEGFTENYAAKFQEDEAFSVVCKSLKEIDKLYTVGAVDFFCFSSWCRFPVYENDFGWGKPRWVSIANLVCKNVIVMMDTKDGSGIEAWVSLSEEDMEFFERDKELIEFAYLNPKC